MIVKGKNGFENDRMRWIMLLFAVAVILPAVCLIWFMNQAMKNERLAIRQRLIDSYTNRAEDIFFKFPNDYWSSAEKILRALSGNINETDIINLDEFQAVVFYDQNDMLIYPRSLNQRDTILSQSVQKIWKLEYIDADYDAAISEYEKKANISSIPDEVYDCRMGIVRCLVKQNKIEEAAKICSQLAYPGESIINE